MSVLSWAVTGHTWRIVLRKGSFPHLFLAYSWDSLSKLQLYAVYSEVDAQMKEIQPSLRGSSGSNPGHEKVKLAINNVQTVSTRSWASREYEEPVINHWKKTSQAEWHFDIWVFCQDFPGSSSRHLIWILFVNVLGLVRKESFCNEYNTLYRN